MTAKQRQCLLVYLGYDTGGIDGVWGPKSQEASRAFLQRAGKRTEEALENALLEAITQKGQDPWQNIRHFSRQEFACRCGKCGGFPTEPDTELVCRADALREALGVPIHISSGVRCKAHNTAVGGVSNSRHLTGKAMDFRAEGFSAAQVLARVNLLGGIRYAYAIDERYIHMDVE